MLKWSGWARHTHVQCVLCCLRLRTAVEADKAHGLWRKDRSHQSGSWGAERGAPHTREWWDSCPVWSSSYLLGGEFDKRPFVPLQGKD